MLVARQRLPWKMYYIANACAQFVDSPRASANERPKRPTPLVLMEKTLNTVHGGMGRLLCRLYVRLWQCPSHRTGGGLAQKRFCCE